MMKSAGQGRLVALVVTHNRLDQLQQTVQRLLESPPAHLAAIIVCDNASTDGTAAWLAGGGRSAAGCAAPGGQWRRCCGV